MGRRGDGKEAAAHGHHDARPASDHGIFFTRRCGRRPRVKPYLRQSTPSPLQERRHGATPRSGSSGSRNRSSPPASSRQVPRTGILLPTFLTSARWRTAHPRFCQFWRVPSAPDDGTRPGLFAPLVRVALDVPEHRLHHDPNRAAEDLLHSTDHIRLGAGRPVRRRPSPWSTA
jgi:hypothetical protein